MSGETGGLTVYNDEAKLAEALRRAGVEVGSVGGDHFRRVVANRLLESEWLSRYVERIVAAHLADADARLAAVEALLAEWDDRIEDRRASTPNIGRDDRQPWVHFTAGLSEARDLLRAALHPVPDDPA